MGDSIHDDSDVILPRGSDSAVGTKLRLDPSVLKIYQTGVLTVVGFGGQDVPDEVCIAGYRDQLNELIDVHHCEVMAFDLSGVKFMPSGLLGVLATLRRRVQKIEIYNASPNIRETLEITNLDRLLELRDVDVPS